MTQTASVQTITDYQVAMFQTDLSIAGKLVSPIVDIYYGDQTLIPRYPALAIESSHMASHLGGAPYRTDNQLTTILIAYASKLQDNQSTRREADIFAESVRWKLHQDRTMGGLVIHGFVTTIEYGYAIRKAASGQDVIIRAARITWEGLTKIPLDLG